MRCSSFSARALLFLFLLLTLAIPASAHGYIVRSIPEDRAVLDRAPLRVQYWFSETLEPAFSSITVRSALGEIIATGGLNPNNDALLEVQLPTNLPDGAYINDLRIAFASDGHVIAESRVFFVGEAVSGVAGASANDAAVPLEVVWRALVYGSVLLLLGTFGLYNGVLLPAWGNSTFLAGGLPPRVMARLNALVVIALIIAFAASLLALLQQTMTFFGADAGRVLGEGLWRVVRIGTRFGDTWNARMLLLFLIAGIHAAGWYLRHDQPQGVRASWSANLWATLLLAATFSVSSHAAGSLTLPWIAILADWLHLAAVGVWAGGLAALVLVLPVALAPYLGEARRQALIAVLNRFSPIAAACLFVVVATGIYSASNWITQPNDITSRYTLSLGVKVLLVGGLVALGAAHYAALHPNRHARWRGVVERIGGFTRTLRLETVFALATIIGAAVLSATPVPQPELAGQTSAAPTATIFADGLAITTTISPGGPGVNTYDLVVEQDGSPIEDARVRLQLVNPALDRRGAWQTAEPTADGVYVGAGADITREGEWQMLVDVQAAGVTTRAAFAWTITQEAAVIQSRPPSIINLLALAGVMVAIGFAIAVPASRFYSRLDRSPAAVLVAAGASLAGVAIVVVGLWLSGTQAAAYDATVLPPPQVVNVILPDAESLGRGRALLARCAGWGEGREWESLLERLPRLRDEDLFAATGEGWRTLPACDAALTDVERWDVVNAVRAYQGTMEQT